MQAQVQNCKPSTVLSSDAEYLRSSGLSIYLVLSGSVFLMPTEHRSGRTLARHPWKEMRYEYGEKSDCFNLVRLRT